MRRLSIVLMLAVAGTGVAGKDPAEAVTTQPWFVRVAPVMDTVPCSGAVVRLHVDPWHAKEVRVPVESTALADAEWSMQWLEPGSYELVAQLVSCDGVPGPPATVGFDLQANDIRKVIYVGLREQSSTMTLDYLEIASERDGTGVIQVERQDRDMAITNVSDAPLSRCTYEPAYLDEQFLADGTWDEYDVGLSREWPEYMTVLQPGETVTVSWHTTMVRARDTNPRLVRPTAKRYKLTIQPPRQTYVTLTEPPWVPAGLPSCDRLHLELPTTDDDPTIRIWDEPSER